MSVLGLKKRNHEVALDNMEGSHKPTLLYTLRSGETEPHVAPC